MHHRNGSFALQSYDRGIVGEKVQHWRTFCTGIMWGEGNSFTSACEHRCGEESVLHLSSLISWVSKQSLQIFTSFSLTIHITHVILTHVAFNGSFTNQVFVTFNEHYFTPGMGTICRTDVRYFSAAAASVWTAGSEKKKRCYFVRGGYIFNTIRPSKSRRCKRSGWKKTVTVSDSLGGNVINCK